MSAAVPRGATEPLASIVPPLPTDARASTCIGADAPVSSAVIRKATPSSPRAKGGDWRRSSKLAEDRFSSAVFTAMRQAGGGSDVGGGSIGLTSALD